MEIFGINLFNRKAQRKYSSGVSIAADKPTKETAAQDPQWDALYGLTKDTIETDLRLQENRGVYAVPAWTFRELTRVCAELGNKVNFWRSRIGALEWSIRVSDRIPEGQEERAKKQEHALKDHYNRIRNLRKAIRHLALAKFYGFAILKIEDGALLPIQPWNVIHDLEWQGDDAPSYGWYFNRLALGQLDKKEMPEMTTDEYVIRESDESNLIPLMLLGLSMKTIGSFREKNLEEASKNQIVIFTGDKLPEKGTDEYNNMLAALRDARDGRSVVLAKGDPACPTEIVKPPAAAGLSHYNETLAKEGEVMTQSVTGGLLTMLSMPTGIGSGASDAHSETLAALLKDDAKGICEALWESIDRPVLAEAGLLAEDEEPLAWFELAQPDKKDIAVAAKTITLLKGAGYAISDETASDMLGIDVVSQKEQAQTDEPQREERKKEVEEANDLRAEAKALQNRVKETLNERKLSGLDDGFFAFLDKLAEKTGQEVPDDKWRAKIMDAISSADPKDLMNSDTFCRYLEKAILTEVRNDEDAA